MGASAVAWGWCASRTLSRRATAVRRIGAVDAGVAIAPAARLRRRLGAWIPGRRALRHGKVDLGAECRVLDDHLLRPLQAPVPLCLLGVLRVNTALLR